MSSSFSQVSDVFRLLGLLFQSLFHRGKVHQTYKQNCTAHSEIGKNSQKIASATDRQSSGSLTDAKTPTQWLTRIGVQNTI